MKPVLVLPKIYPILDGPTLARADADPVEAAEAFLEGGATWLQLRWKADFTQEAFDKAKQIAALCQSSGVEFILNDRADVARLLGAGLHVGQSDLPAADARNQLGLGPVLGLSTHNHDQFTHADPLPVDYLTLGPIFETASKPNPDPVLGTVELARLRPLSAKPLVAIGGITLENAAEVWKAGADSLALIADLYKDGCSKAQLRSRMEQWFKYSQDAIH